MNEDESYVDYFTEILLWNESANIPATGDEATLKEKLRHIVEEASELAEAVTAADECDACVDLVWVILGYMRAKGWNVPLAFDNVASSNFSKFFPIGDADKALEFAKQAGYTGAYVETVGSELGVLKDSSGKVKKPHTFYEPDHTIAVQ